MRLTHVGFVACGIPTGVVQGHIRLIAIALGFPSMITLFLAGLASVAVGPLLAIFVADRATDAASTVPASAGMFVAPSNDNAAIAAQRAA